MRSYEFSLVLFLVLWSCVAFMNGCCGIEGFETRLIKKLMKDYDVDARPVKNQSQPVKVELELLYKELKKMDEPDQSMESITWFRIKWKDDSLQWNESEYGGISTIRLDPSRVWKPDLTLYNSVHEDGGDLYSFKTRPIISSDGTLNWLTPAILKTTCKLDISKFPFDEQKCILKIGSWTYPSFALDLNVSKDQERAGLENYTENTEWDLLSVDTRKSNKKYSCCPEPYHDLTYTFHFRRKPWYYIISIVFPCIVLSLLASISFLFPAESGERISLVISILLGLTVFMLIVNDRTPVSSDGTPMITRYFSAICFTVLVILLATAFILRIYHESPSSPVPYYLASLRDFFVVVLFMKTSGEEARRRDLAKAARLSYLRQLNACSKNQLSMDKILFQFQRSVIRQEEDFTNQLKEDWQCTARVFDILFFCLFLLVFLVLNIYVFSFL